MQAIFKDAVLPGSKTFNNLPPGSAVICHSALVHGRRAQPGGEDKPRYFLDISYCRECTASAHPCPPRGLLSLAYLEFVAGAGAGSDRAW